MERLRAKESRDVTIGSFKFLHKFDAGAFGDIYLGTNILNGEKVAIKVESYRVRYPHLEYEWRVYRAMQPYEGLPQIKYFCREPSFSSMVMELMGPSLEHLFQNCHRNFTLKTILMLAEQMLQRLEYVHNHGFVHRDIKPENFVMGRGGKSKMVFLIDFGLAKKFWNPSTDVHIPYREDCGLTGTARYASLCAHEGMEQSRRDDLMSVGYVLIYFLRGSLPWQGLQASTKEQKYKLIQEMKQSISNERLCEGIPSEFTIYLNYCRGLGFYDKPNYAFLRALFNHLFQSMYFARDNLYDWEMLRMVQMGHNNPGTGKRVFPPKLHSDNGYSGRPIV